MHESDFVTFEGKGQGAMAAAVAAYCVLSQPIAAYLSRLQIDDVGKS